MRRLIVRAFLMRGLVALLLEFTGTSQQFAPDELTYSQVGESLARYWSGDAFAPPSHVTTDQPTGYFYLNAASIFFFGSVFPLKLLNAFVGARACLYPYLLGRALFGPSVARRATLLYAYLPSLVLWSALNIRDVWAIFLILFVSWKSYELAAGYSHMALFQLIAGIALLSTFRQYLFFVVALPPVVGLLLGRGKHPGRNAFLAAAAAVAIVILVQVGAAEHSIDLMSLEALAEARAGMTLGAGSAFGAGVDISSPARALAYLPTGIAYFLFSPFPWQITSFLKAASLPEMLFLYWITPSLLRGVKYGMTFRFRECSQVLLLTGLLVVSYSLGSGNVGTLYRHRAQALPLLLLFAAKGLDLKRRRRGPARTAG